MEISRLSQLRPRTVWDVVDDAFDLYRENFALFAGIVALVYVPAYIVLLTWMASWFPLLSQSSGGDDPADPSSVFGTFLGGAALALPLFGAAFVLYGGAIAVAVEDRLSGRPSGIGPAYRRVLKRFWPLLGASIIVFVLALVGACAVYIGTILVVVFYAFVAQAVVLEGRGALAAGHRSRELVWGNGMKVFGLILLLALLSVILSLGISSLMEAALYFAPKSGDVAAQEGRDFLLQQVASALASVILAPLAPIATTLMYYDLRVRREGLDIEAQAAAIGFPLAPDPFGGVANPKIPHAAYPGAVTNPPA